MGVGVHWRILCMHVFIAGCGRCCLNTFLSRFHALLRSGMQRGHKSGCNGWLFYGHHCTHHSLSTNHLPTVSNTFSGLSLSWSVLYRPMDITLSRSGQPSQTQVSMPCGLAYLVLSKCAAALDVAVVTGVGSSSDWCM